jgi:predicted ArsR family transcriptional regulator
MKSHRDKILELLIEVKVVTSSEVARVLKVSWNTAESHLKDLVIEGEVERIKKEGVNLWVKK